MERVIGAREPDPVSTSQTATAPGSVLGRMATPVMLAIAALSIVLAILLYVQGDPPIVYDAANYVLMATSIVQQGFWNTHNDTRTYGYPGFLSLVIRALNLDLDRLTRIDNTSELGPGAFLGSFRTVVFAIQWLLLCGVAWFGARRLGSIFGTTGALIAAFAAAMLNPFLLIRAGEILTDLSSAVLVYAALLFSLKAPGDGRLRTGLYAGGAFLAAALATIVRPADAIVVLALGAVWVIRAVQFRDVPWWAVPVGLVAGVVPCVPQLILNYQGFGVISPLIVQSLYTAQLSTGMAVLKYATVVVPNVDPRLFYVSPFRLASATSPLELLRQAPLNFLATIGLHAFGLLDQDLPYTYVRDLNPWYRWPLSLVSDLYGAWIGTGVLLGALCWWRSRARPRLDAFACLAALLVSGSYVAVYLGTVVEIRFTAPLYLLLIPGLLYLLAVGRDVVRSRGRLTLVLAVSAI